MGPLRRPRVADPRPALAARYPRSAPSGRAESTTERRAGDLSLVSTRFPRPMVLSSTRTFYIDPSRRTTISYFSYSSSRHDARRAPGAAMVCETGGEGRRLPGPSNRLPSRRPEPPTSASWRSRGRRCADLSPGSRGDGEYSAAVSLRTRTSVPCALGAIVTSINRVNDLRAQDRDPAGAGAENNDLIVYTNVPPIRTPTTTTAMLNQNQANLDTIIGSTNYDIGHASARRPATLPKASFASRPAKREPGGARSGRGRFRRRPHGARDGPSVRRRSHLRRSLRRADIIIDPPSSAYSCGAAAARSSPRRNSAARREPRCSAAPICSIHAPSTRSSPIRTTGSSSRRP